MRNYCRIDRHRDPWFLPGTLLLEAREEKMWLIMIRPVASLLVRHWIRRPVAS
jgi:hypothetical protein